MSELKWSDYDFTKIYGQLVKFFFSLTGFLYDFSGSISFNRHYLITPTMSTGLNLTSNIESEGKNSILPSVDIFCSTSKNVVNL